jgi:hypothetical protein
MPRRQEFVYHPRSGRSSKPLGQGFIPQEFAYRLRRGFEIVRVIDQKTLNPIIYLVLDPANPASDDWASLPHRFGNGQTKTFAQTLLNNYAGVALQGIHHRRVFGRIRSRQGNDVYAPPGEFRQRTPMVENGLQHRYGLGIVGHTGYFWPNEHQVRSRPVALGRYLNESVHDPNRILQRIPSSDL